MIPFRKSIGFRLLLVSFVLLALPLLIDSFILIQQKYERAIDEAKGKLREIAHHRGLPISKIQPISKPLTTLIIKSFDLESNFPEQPTAELNEKLKSIAAIGNFWSVILFKITPDNRAIVVASNLESEIGHDYTRLFKLNELFSAQGLAKGYTTSISYDLKNLEPYFVISRLIFPINKPEPIGVLAIFVDISDTIRQLMIPLEREFPVKFALVLNSGIVFAASDPNLRLQFFFPLDARYKKLFKEEFPFAGAYLPNEPLQLKEPSSYPYIEFKWNDENQIGYFQDIIGTDYSLLAYTSSKDIFQSPIRTFFRLYSLYGALLLLGGCVAWLLTRRLTRPIQDLSKVMLGIQQGNLQLRYKPDMLGFEINSLGEIFNQTVDSLLHQKKQVEEERIDKELVVQELRLGQQVQRSLLPHQLLHYPGVEIAERYIPAIEVGGDFYDVFIKTKDGHDQVVLAIADASGKGVQACLFSLNVRNMLRTYAKEYDDVAIAMRATNTLFLLDTVDSGMFVTTFMCIFDNKTHELQYHSCGHNPPLIRRADGKIETLELHGAALGVAVQPEHPAVTTRLEKGDLLLLYTDGITEAHDEEFRQYGEERLIEFLKKNGTHTPAELIDALVAEVTTFCGSAPQHDDITLLVMRVVE